MSEPSEKSLIGELAQLFAGYIKDEMSKCETLAELEERVEYLSFLLDSLTDELHKGAHKAVGELLFERNADE